MVHQPTHECVTENPRVFVPHLHLPWDLTASISLTKVPNTLSSLIVSQSQIITLTKGGGGSNAKLTGLHSIVDHSYTNKFFTVIPKSQAEPVYR